MAGIELDPEGAGYDRIVIRPRPGGGLTRARAEYDSVRGRIESAWSTVGDRFDLEVTIPPNTRATVHIPTVEGAGVTEGGRPAEEAGGVEFLRKNGEEAALSVGSGRYEFAGRVAGRR